MTQADRNPFKYSNTNKRYYTYDYYLKTAFLQKCAKITLDAGFTCPNIDGTVGVGGCIYCQGGSGRKGEIRCFLQKKSMLPPVSIRHTPG